MRDAFTIYDQATKLGAPLLFSYGLWRGWWYLKPHVEMLVGRISELTVDLKAAREQTSRATDLAEQSYAIAIEARTESKEHRVLLERIDSTLHDVVERLEGGSWPDELALDKAYRPDKGGGNHKRPPGKSSRKAPSGNH